MIYTRCSKPKSQSRSSSLCGTLEDKTAYYSSGQSQATHDRNAHQTLFGDLVIDQRTEAGSLQVPWFLLQQQIIVSPGFAVVSELVVPQGQVVETFASSLWGSAEDF